MGREERSRALAARHPRPLLDKLGVKPGARVALVALDEAELPESPRTRTDDVTLGRPRTASDLVLAYFERREDVGALARLRERIKPDGAIWAVWPKRRKEIREDDFRDAGPALGLVDVKVVAVSERLSGLKLVIPLALRARVVPAPRSPRSPRSRGRRPKASKTTGRGGSKRR